MNCIRKWLICLIIPCCAPAFGWCGEVRLDPKVQDGMTLMLMTQLVDSDKSMNEVRLEGFRSGDGRSVLFRIIRVREKMEIKEHRMRTGDPFDLDINPTTTIVKGLPLSEKGKTVLEREKTKYTCF